MRIGYAKIGRSLQLTLSKCGFVGGDNEGISVLVELARRHPEDEFVIIGRNSGEDPRDIGLPSNITNPWVEWQPEIRAWMKANITLPLDIEDHIKLGGWHRENTFPVLRNLDGFLIWIGQHGTSNYPIPRVENPAELTKPQDSFAHYVSYIIHGINAWRDVDPWNREEVYINADPRNYLKLRDLKWPLRHPIITQFNYIHDIKHERYGDVAVPPAWKPYVKKVEGGVWCSSFKNEYHCLEVCGVLPGTPVGDMLTYDENFEGRQHFGLFINEARSYVKEELSRRYVVKNYVLPLRPAFIHGEWSDESLATLGIGIQPAPFDTFNDKYHSVRCTFTTPSSGSGWATTKPWEAFACGTVCFFHYHYDLQKHISGAIADPEIRGFLRVFNPSQLAERVTRLQTDKGLWLKIIRAQRAAYDKEANDRRYVKAIERRLWVG